MPPRTGGRKKKQRIELQEIKVKNLEPGSQGHIVVRVTRLWDTILPSQSVTLSKELLLTDDQRGAIHATIPGDQLAEMQNKFRRGSIYKLENFQVVPRKATHNAVPGQYNLSIASTTQVCEITQGSNQYPEHHFNFASYEQIQRRHEKEYFLTDVIGILMSITPINNVTFSPSKSPARASSTSKSTTTKRDILLKLISGQTLKVTVWQNHIHHIPADELLLRQSKPIVVIAGATVKLHMGEKILNTTSATKIYLDLDIPEAATFHAMIHEEKGSIKALTNEEAVIASMNVDAEVKTIQQLYWLKPQEIKGLKFKIEAEVTEVIIRKNWLYEVCSDCTSAVSEVRPGVYKCTDHEFQSPRPIQRLHLLLDDGSGTVEAVAFGNVAEDISGINFNVPSILHGLDKTVLPPGAEEKILDYFTFILGNTDQTSSRLNWKIYAAERLPPQEETDNDSSNEHLIEDSTPAASARPNIDDNMLLSQALVHSSSKSEQKSPIKPQTSTPSPSASKSHVPHRASASKTKHSGKAQSSK